MYDLYFTFSLYIYLQNIFLDEFWMSLDEFKYRSYIYSFKLIYLVLESSDAQIELL